MANVLTDLAADIYVAADIVGRELVGAIPSSLINATGAERAAKGDTVRSFATRAPTVNNYAPAMTPPEGDDQTVDNKTMTLSTAKAIEIPWTGEDMKHVDNGNGFETIYGDQIMQAMRSLTNLMEVDLCSAAYKAASRAVGTAGTTPFGSNFDTIAQVRQILVDNGAPPNGDSTLVLNTAAGTKLRNLASLQKVNESGNDQLLRRGTLLDLQGLMLKESAGVQTHTKGTGASYVTNGTFAVGDTVIDIDTGTGTVLAGDIVTFNGDTNNYVVTTALAGGSITIAAPGLQAALGDGVAMTVGNSFTGNVAFNRRAMELAVRPPAMPKGGDAAVDSMIVQDPFSGLVYEIRAYKGYGKAMFSVVAVWGVMAWKPDFIAILMG